MKVLYPTDPIVLAVIALHGKESAEYEDLPVMRPDQIKAIERVRREMDLDGNPEATGSALIGAGLGSGKTVITAEVILDMYAKTSDAERGNLRVLIVGVRDAYGQWAEALRDQSDGALPPLRRIMNTSKAGQAARADFMAGVPGIYYSGLELLRAGDWETKVGPSWEMDESIKSLFPPGVVPDFTEPERKRVQRRVYRKIRPPDLIISDESHKHSTRGTAGLKTIHTIPSRRKIALSGTFYGDRFENAWATGRWLFPEARDADDNWIVNPNFKVWLRQHAIVQKVFSKAGRPVKTPRGAQVTKVTGERVPGSFVKSLPCYVFIKTPVGPVPPSEIVKVELTGVELTQYRQMERQSLAWLKTETGAKKPLRADLPVTQRIRLRSATLGEMTLVPREGYDEDGNELPPTITFSPGCKSAKLAALHKVLHRPTWIGKKALILVHSKSFAKETARRIAAKYPGQVVLKTGDTRPKDWDTDKARFMQPLTGDPSQDVLYLVAVISAVGTATDGLQRECSKVVWLSEDEWETANIQGSNRVWRSGVNMDEYESVKIVTDDTIDEEVMENNEKKKSGILGGVEHE